MVRGCVILIQLWALISSYVFTSWNAITLKYRKWNSQQLELLSWFSFFAILSLTRVANYEKSHKMPQEVDDCRPLEEWFLLRQVIIIFELRVLLLLLLLRNPSLLVRFVGQNCRYFNGQMLLGLGPSVAPNQSGPSDRVTRPHRWPILPAKTKPDNHLVLEAAAATAALLGWSLSTKNWRLAYDDDEFCSLCWVFIILSKGGRGRGWVAISNKSSHLQAGPTLNSVMGDLFRTIWLQ